MNCPKCGAQIPDTSKFCTSCGAQLESAASESTAPEVSMEPAQSVQQPGYSLTPQDYLNSLIRKKRTSGGLAIGGGVYGMVMGALFLALTIVFIISLIYYSDGYYTGSYYTRSYYYEEVFLAYVITFGILTIMYFLGGIFNFIYAGRQRRCASQLMKNPHGIVSYHASQDHSIANLVLSIIFITNPLGIAASIVGIVAKSQVLNNRNMFDYFS